MDNEGWEQYKAKNFDPEWSTPKCAPQTMIPALDRLGAEGWELVHMEPVGGGTVGKNLDVGTPWASVTMWSNAYFCVFKRPQE